MREGSSGGVTKSKERLAKVHNQAAARHCLEAVPF